MRVAVIGRTRMLLESARVVAKAGHTIPLVVPSPAAPHYGVGADAFEAPVRGTSAIEFSRNETSSHVSADTLAAGNVADGPIRLSYQRYVAG